MMGRKIREQRAYSAITLGVSHMCQHSSFELLYSGDSSGWWEGELNWFLVGTVGNYKWRQPKNRKHAHLRAVDARLVNFTVLTFLLYNSALIIFKKIYLFEREGVGERWRYWDWDLPCSVCWTTPQILQWPGLGQAEARAKSLIWVTNMGDMAQKPGLSLATFPGALTGSCIWSGARGPRLGP